MPADLRAKVAHVDVLIRREGTKSVLDSIDNLIPYQAPQTQP